MKSRALNSVSPQAKAIINLICILYSIACIVPLLIVIAVSFSRESLIAKFGYGIIPRDFTLDAYIFVLREGNLIFNAYLVTLIATVAGTFCSLMVISMFAYPLSRKSLKYRNFFSFFVFFTMLFNGGLVPWYIICSQVLHITDSIFALFLPYVVNAWYIMIVRTFFSTTIPESVIESARIDGASEVRTFFQIVIPLSKPVLATIGLFSTLGIWNDWWLSMILTSKPKLSSLQYLLYRMLTNIEMLSRMRDAAAAQTSDMLAKSPLETSRMAMCILAIGPMILAYPYFQRYFIKGLTIGAVKG